MKYVGVLIIFDMLKFTETPKKLTSWLWRAVTLSDINQIKDFKVHQLLTYEIILGNFVSYHIYVVIIVTLIGGEIVCFNILS